MGGRLGEGQRAWSSSGTRLPSDDYHTRLCEMVSAWKKQRRGYGAGPRWRRLRFRLWLDFRTVRANSLAVGQALRPEPNPCGSGPRSECSKNFRRCGRALGAEETRRDSREMATGFWTFARLWGSAEGPCGKTKDGAREVRVFLLRLPLAIRNDSGKPFRDVPSVQKRQGRH